MSDRLQCGLCGLEDHGVAWRRLVAWTDDERRRRPELPPFDTIDRCLDYQACRKRVEESGRSWPVHDAVTRPTVAPSPQREEVPI
jgi:hypothetical protein